MCLRRLRKYLDAIDIEILRILSEDCRTTTKEIAERLGVSVPVVRKRIKRLEASGVLEGCRAKVNSDSFNAATAIISVKTDDPYRLYRVLDETLSGVEKFYYSDSRKTAYIVMKVLDLRDIDRVFRLVEEKSLGGGVDVITIDSVLKDSQWIPNHATVININYICAFCKAPILGKPYIVEIDGKTLVFHNEKCAEAYFRMVGIESFS